LRGRRAVCGILGGLLLVLGVWYIICAMSTQATRVVLVTGAGSGIGEATAKEFASRGWRVVASDVNVDAAKETAHEIGDGDSVAVELDVTDLASVERGVQEALEWGQSIDALVNNAGIISPHSLLDTPPDLWERTFDINVHGIYRCCRAVLPGMLERKSGVIINVASAAGLVGIPNRAAYCASKGAVVTMTKSLAVDYIRDGIRANCVCPGTANTPWVQGLIERSADPEATRANLIARQPIGRLAEPEEIAKAIAYLASDDAAYVTGSAFVIDGGILAG
jgi:2-keto-3-deoxy-L-fuconate dehydrogenase